jgi:single-stranded DNA-binding protein
MSVGQWEIEGRLGKDPVYKGSMEKEFAILSVAADKGYGENKKTVWISVFARKFALKQARFLKKGDLVICKGDPIGMLGKKMAADGVTEVPEAQVCMSCFNLKHIHYHKEENPADTEFTFDDTAPGQAPPAFREPPTQPAEAHPAATGEDFIEGPIPGLTQAEAEALPI